MHRIHHNIKHLLFGAFALSLLLSACNNANPAKPDDNQGKQPPAPSKPVEKDMLNFKVRALTVDKAERGFRVYSSVQQIQVSVAKGAKTATKTQLIDAIKAKDPEMLGIGEFQLFKTNKVTADIYSEYDAGLKNNASVFIGKNSHTRSITFMLKSIIETKDGYRPVEDYKDGKKLTVRVSHEADQAAITTALKDEVEKTVRMGTNYTILYRLFADERGVALAYDRNFADKGTVYIGKKAMKPTITLKAVAAKTPAYGGFIYSGLTDPFATAKIDNAETVEEVYPIVPDTILTLDRELSDTTSMEEVRRLFEAKIRDTLDSVAHKYKLKDEDYEYRAGLFSDKDGKVFATANDFKDGATIYVGKKMSRRVLFDVTGVLDTIKVAAVANGCEASLGGAAAVEFKVPMTTAASPAPAPIFTKPFQMTVEVAIVNANEKVYEKTFWARVRQELRKSQVGTHFPSTNHGAVPDAKIGFFRNPSASGASQAIDPADRFEDTDTRTLTGFNRRVTIYVGKVD